MEGARKRARVSQHIYTTNPFSGLDGPGELAHDLQRLHKSI